MTPKTSLPTSPTFLLHWFFITRRTSFLSYLWSYSRCHEREIPHKFIFCHLFSCCSARASDIQSLAHKNSFKKKKKKKIRWMNRTDVERRSRHIVGQISGTGLKGRSITHSSIVLREKLLIHRVKTARCLRSYDKG